MAKSIILVSLFKSHNSNSINQTKIEIKLQELGKNHDNLFYIILSTIEEFLTSFLGNTKKHLKLVSFANVYKYELFDFFIFHTTFTNIPKVILLANANLIDT
jgi:hypothetical protein